MTDGATTTETGTAATTDTPVTGTETATDTATETATETAGTATETTTAGTDTETTTDTTTGTTGPAPVCGDGILEGGEACDDGAANGPGQACKADCTLNVCGDAD